MTLLDLDEPSTRDHVTRCSACQHTLKTPESRALGLGPDCASKLGLTPRKPLRISGVPTGWDIVGQGDLLEEGPVYDRLNATIRKRVEEQERTVRALGDLAAFLRERIGEDEQTARAADQRSWTYEYGEFRSRSDGDNFVHLLRHSPARVLREVEARRRLLDDVLPVIDELDEIAYGEGQGSVPYLEPRARFLKALAMPYSDHPDYRPEWAPEGTTP